MADTLKNYDVFHAEVISVNGECEAGHVKGQKMILNCWDSGGLCGFFYHDIFPSLQTLQFGGTIPWSPDGVLTLECPDRHNAVTIKLSKK